MKNARKGRGRKGEGRGGEAKVTRLETDNDDRKRRGNSREEE